MAWYTAQFGFKFQFHAFKLEVLVGGITLKTTDSMISPRLILKLNWLASTTLWLYFPGRNDHLRKSPLNPLPIEPPPMPPQGTPAYGPGFGGSRRYPCKSNIGSRLLFRSLFMYWPAQELANVASQSAITHQHVLQHLIAEPLQALEVWKKYEFFYLDLQRLAFESMNAQANSFQVQT